MEHALEAAGEIITVAAGAGLGIGVFVGIILLIAACVIKIVDKLFDF